MSATEEIESEEKKASRNEWKRGWIIVMAGFLLCFVSDGIVLSYGVLLVELVEYFDETRATTATIGSLLSMMIHFTAPLVSVMGDKLGYRLTVIIGVILSCIGCFLSYFATNIYYLWISYGLLTGFGFGLMFMPAFVCVLRHFVKNRTLANGITICGTGTGTFVFNYSTSLLIDYYGWRGTMLIHAGIVLQGAVLALLVAGPKEKVPVENIEDNITSPTCTSCVSSLKTIITSMFNKELLTDRKFNVFLLGAFVISLVFIVPFTFVPDQAEQLGMTKREAAMLASSIGIANIPSRVIFGWIGDRVCFNRIYLLGGVAFINGLISGVSPYMTSFEMKLTYTCLFGTLIGAYAALLFTVVADNVRPELMPSALGLLFLTLAIGNSVSTPIAGMLFDKTGSYTTTFIVCGSGFVLGSLLFFICQFIKPKNGSYDLNSDKRTTK